MSGHSTEIALRDEAVELAACRDALANIEVYIYETWEFRTITKDAARHFVTIAEIAGWTMPWVQEMREWAS